MRGHSINKRPSRAQSRSKERLRVDMKIWGRNVWFGSRPDLNENHFSTCPSIVIAGLLLERGILLLMVVYLLESVKEWGRMPGWAFSSCCFMGLASETPNPRQTRSVKAQMNLYPENLRCLHTAHMVVNIEIGIPWSLVQSLLSLNLKVAPHQGRWGRSRRVLDRKIIR